MSVSEARADHDALAQRDAELASWIETGANHVGEVDGESAQRFVETYRRLTERLNAEPPPVLSEAAISTIRKLIIEGMSRAADPARPADVLDGLLINAEGIRHVIRDTLDGDVPVDERDAAALLSQLEGWLPGVSQGEIAELLGVSRRTIQRWGTSHSSPTARAVLAGQLVALLRHGWSPAGVVAWFSRPRRDLGHRRPIDLLDDPAHEQALIGLARAGRAQHGS